MNLKLILTSTALASILTISQAQNVRPVFVTRLNFDHGDRASNQLMRQGEKEVREGLNKLEHALPIYEGHREKSIDLSQSAIVEINMGVAWNRRHDDLKRGTGVHDMSAADGRRQYDRRKIEASQKKIRTALEELREGKRILETAKPDYDGHRVSAIRDLDDAIREGEIALHLHN